MIYFVILLIIMFCVWHFDMRKSVKWKDAGYWGIFVIFFLVSALRYKIGADTRVYMRTWEFYPDIWEFHWIDDIAIFQNSSLEVERFQPGWIIFCMLMKGICSSYFFMQAVSALIFNAGLFHCVKRYSKYPFITLMMFFISFKFLEFEFEILREAVATGVFLLIAFDAWVEKKWTRYYIGTALAFLLHNSAVLMFALPLLRNIDWSLKKYTLLFFVPSFILSVAGRALIGNMVNIFLGGSGFVAEYARNAMEGDTNVGYLLMYGLQPLLMYLLAAFFFNKIKQKEFRVLIFFSTIFMNLSMIYFTTSRLVNYIMIVDFIALTPVIYYIMKKCHTVWVGVAIMLIYFIPTLYGFQKPENIARYHPYQWIVNPKQTELQKSI